MFGKPGLMGSALGPMIGRVPWRGARPWAGSSAQKEGEEGCGQDSVHILWKIYSVSSLSNSPIIGQFVFASRAV